MAAGVRCVSSTDVKRPGYYFFFFHFAHSFSVISSLKGGTFSAFAILMSVSERNQIGRAHV